MKVRLTRKHAEQIDGINLSGYEVGDMLDLTPDEARLIIAEEWALPDRRSMASATEYRRRSEDQSSEQRSRFPEEDQRALAAERPPRDP